MSNSGTNQLSQFPFFWVLVDFGDSVVEVSGVLSISELMTIYLGYYG